DDSRFISSYLAAFDGYYLTGDSGYLDEDGYVYVMGRTDDVINVAGHRLTTGIIEAVVASHPPVAETACIGAHDEVQGPIPPALGVLGDSSEAADPDAVIDELVALLRKEIGPVAAFRHVDIVPGLPKIRSGKILRKTMRELADGVENPAVPATIEDRPVLD